MPLALLLLLPRRALPLPASVSWRGARRGAARVLLCISFTVCALALGCREPAPPQPAAPSFLLVSIDTLRADHTSPYGYARDTTPFLSELAARGVVFEQAFSHSPKTAISHMSILTGLYPDAHGVVQNGQPDTRRLNERIPTLATLLSRAGYRTAAVTAGANVAPELGFDQGMDHFDVVGEIAPAFDAGLGRLREFASGEAPGFLFLHTFEVHTPYTPAGRYAKLYTDPSYNGNIIGSQQALWQLGQGQWEAQHRIFMERIDTGDPRDIAQLKALYDGGIRLTDDTLRRLVERAEREGLLENTWILVLSDHGEQFMEHGELLHGMLYEELLHVPLLIVPPRGRHPEWPGRRISSVARMVDVAPTILALAGQPAPKTMDGQSLLALLEGTREAGGPEPREAEVPSTHHKRGLQGLRRGPWKLIHRDFQWEGKPFSKQELYHLPDDPHEQRDLRKKKPLVALELSKSMQETAAKSRSFLETRGGPGPRVGTDEATRARLRALGYLE